MKILQVTNIICHLQLPLARSITKLVGEKNFRFVATAPPDPERTKLGWNQSVQESWILRAGETESERDEFERWWDEADIVFCGDRRFDRMLDRLKSGKICFYMSERWWKPPLGKGRMFWPPFFKLVKRFREMTKYPQFHYLPIGVYAARDIKVISDDLRNMWKWGYFLDGHGGNNFESVKFEKQNKLNVLWAGRMLGWKKVDTLIKATAEALSNGASVKLTIVGAGPERDAWQKLASRLLPSGSYEFMNPVPPSEVLNLMLQHDVYVLPSNAYEGWGAVVNEAMECGSVVLANKEAGASASMIEHGENGLLFSSGDWRTLAQHLVQLESNPSLRQSLARSAQKTVQTLWSPDVAAGRMVELCKSLLSNRPPSRYKYGVLSDASNWLSNR